MGGIKGNTFISAIERIILDKLSRKWSPSVRLGSMIYNITNVVEQQTGELEESFTEEIHATTDHAGILGIGADLFVGTFSEGWQALVAAAAEKWGEEIPSGAYGIYYDVFGEGTQEDPEIVYSILSVYLHGQWSTIADVITTMGNIQEAHSYYDHNGVIGAPYFNSLSPDLPVNVAALGSTNFELGLDNKSAQFGLWTKVSSPTESVNFDIEIFSDEGRLNSIYKIEGIASLPHFENRIWPIEGQIDTMLYGTVTNNLDAPLTFVNIQVWMALIRWT